MVGESLLGRRVFKGERNVKRTSQLVDESEEGWKVRLQKVGLYSCWFRSLDALKLGKHGKGVQFGKMERFRTI